MLAFAERRQIGKIAKMSICSVRDVCSSSPAWGSTLASTALKRRSSSPMARYPFRLGVIPRGHLNCVLGRFEACSQQEAERRRHRDGRGHTQALSRGQTRRSRRKQL